MKLLRLLLGLLLSLPLLPAARAQVVTASPSPFRDTDQVTLTFDANLGSRGLAPPYAGPVYIYTGVITDKSTSPSDWKYIKNPSFGAPTPAELMTPVAGQAGKYSISFVPRTYYGVPAADKMLRLAMVFRGAGGAPEGKGDGNSDIFVDVAQDAFNLRFTSPSGPQPYFFAENTATNVTVGTSTAATITLFLNGVQIAQQAGATTLTAPVTISQAGPNTLRATAEAAGLPTASIETTVQSRPQVSVAALPAGAKPDGVTYLNGGTSVVISLTAPRKQFVYVLGDFNNWQPVAAGFMRRTAAASPSGLSDPASATDAASGRWWVQIDGLTPGREYGYQFLVDGALKLADPYAEKILDPNDDRFIPEITYPAAERAYPTGKTSGLVGVLQTGQTPYAFQVTNFQRPARTNMVVYELHLRDFVARHDFKTVQDTLGYLQRLGVNTIELMPVNEFDGNDSWGYNPDFYFTPDKYYGTRLAFKQFIDECHRRGIAVVMDMVLNQSTGQSPMIGLYADASGFAPRPDNPWYNVTATHPFNVFTDFNHESPYTRYFSKRVMEYWLKEYKVDGYRFDLSKGFTQNVTTSTDAWSRFDQSRINIWLDYGNTIRAADAGAYPILEHFADNEEEKVLSSNGFMLWHNMNGKFNEATMGYNTGDKSDLSAGYYKVRGFAQPNLLTYMESHDEERLAFKNKAYGNSGPNGYNVKELATSMARNETAAAFFFTQPGPKMIWQFGEVGYDFSLFACPNGALPAPPRKEDECKTGAKPIDWDLYKVPVRRRLFDVYRSLIALKTQPVFANPDATVSQNVVGAAKTLSISDASLSVTVVGNFDVAPASVVAPFASTGTWYNYITGASLSVTNTSTTLSLQPGEYAVYTSKKIALPASTLLATRSAARNAASALRLSAAPNPTAAAAATLRYELPTATPAGVQVTVSNLLGATVGRVSSSARQTAGPHELTLPVAGLANGVYLVRLQAGSQQQTTRLVVQH